MSMVFFICLLMMYIQICIDRLCLGWGLSATMHLGRYSPALCAPYQIMGAPQPYYRPRCPPRLYL